jgi:hypothetical protein
MKKILFSVLFLFCINIVFAQVTHTKIGRTTYDLGTNASTYNSIVKNADGTISVVWTFSNSVAASGWSDRGTGYNYFNGTSWINSATTSARIETKRTGFPSIAITNSGAEVITAHDATNNKMTVSRRPVKGTGAWSQTDINTGLVWNRTAIGGPTGETIHMISHDESTAAGLVYYLRSLNAGVTWSSAIEVPGFTIDEFPNLFRGDEYAIAAKGNNVVVVFGGQTMGVHMAKSNDNGATWTNTEIHPFPIANYNPFNDISDVDSDGIADTLNTCDGSVNVSIDNSGIAHVFWGNMRILDDDAASSYSYFPGTDGLMYWNENLTEPKKIAQMVDVNNDGQINMSDFFVPDWGFGMYGSSFSSYPSSAFDANGFIYVAYSGLVEANTQVDISGDMLWTGNTYSGKLTRHIYTIYSGDNGLTWSKPFDTNINNPFYPSKTEAAFPSLASLIDDNLHILYQRDTVPGYGVSSNDDPDNQDLVSDIVYLKVPKTALPCNGFSATINTIKDTCYNSLGAFSLSSVLGVVGTYTYNWGSVDGANNFVSVGLANTSVSGMMSGIYRVAIDDSRACKDTIEFVLQNYQTTINVTLNQSVQPSTCVSLDGAINSSIVGGVAPYSYSWTGSSSTNNSISGVGIGAYVLTVSDKNTCTGAGEIILLPTTNTASFTATITTTSTTCINYTDGKASVAVVPAGSYSYNWLPSNQTNQTATGFSAGTYQMFVSDGICGKVTSFTIAQPSSNVSATLTKTDVLCNGQSNGSITANATGGTPPYTFTWNSQAGGSILVDNSFSTISFLSSGAGYGVSVTDKYSCATSTPQLVSISEPTPLAISFLSRTIPTSATSTDGIIRVLSTGGTPPYNFTWSRTSIPNGSATGVGPTNIMMGAVNITSLKAGYHLVTVVDANGCSAILNYNLLYSNESSDSKLINLVTSVGTLTPTFASNTFNYNVTLPTGTTGVASLTPTLSTTLATIFSNTQASNVAGISPANTAKVVVRSSLGTYSTYTVVYTVANNSSNSLLSNLTTSVGTLSPTFASNVYSYTVVLPVGSSGTASLNPTLADATATITSNTSATNVGGTSPSNVATVVVTAQNGITTSTYMVSYSVATPVSNDATLSFLATNVGSLNPTFVSSITNYTVLLDFGSTGSATIAGATTNAGATILSNQSATDVTGASPANTATIVVLAQDGVTSLTYTIVYSVSTSINEIKTNDVNIFPNPSNGIISVSSENNAIHKIEIANTLGEIIYSNAVIESTQTIDLSNQAKGIYFVRVSSQNADKIQKIVLQ